MTAAAAPRRWQVAGFAAAAFFLILVARFWDPVYRLTGLLQLDTANEATEISDFRRLPVYVYRNTGGYDGLYYAQLAYDPLLGSPELPAAIDNLYYRARRILPPALAWFLAAGRPEAIVHVYSFLNVGLWLGLAALLWRVIAVREGESWSAWACVLFSAGSLASVRFALTDLPAATLVVAAIFATECGRSGWSQVLMGAAGLSKETWLASIPALWTRPWLSGANLRRTVVSVAPLIVWIGYVRMKADPADAGWGNFTWPFMGLLEKIQATAAAFGRTSDTVLVATTLLATLALVVQAAYITALPELGSPWWRLGAVGVLLMVFIGQPVWEGFPGAAIRVLLPLTLAFNVLVVRRKSGFGWLAAGNLGVAAGLLLLVRVPRDLRQIASDRFGGIAAVARLEEGWFDCEHTLSHVWSWSPGHARLEIEAWPKADASLRLTADMRSADARTVVVSQDGKELWRGSLNRAWTPIDLRLRLAAGSGHLEFSSSEPPVPENASPAARRLGFALHDVRLRPAPPARSSRSSPAPPSTASWLSPASSLSAASLYSVPPSP